PRKRLILDNSGRYLDKPGNVSIASPNTSLTPAARRHQEGRQGMQHDGGRSSRFSRRRLTLGVVLVVLVGSAVAGAATVASAGSTKQDATIKVALITKDVTNPFFVKMKEGATASAKKLGAQLLYAAGKNSSDNAGQITAIENMVTAGVKGILITVADGKAENPAIAKARKAGVMVIALDTPTVP